MHSTPRTAPARNDIVWDAIVMGGGPGGSATAAILADKGWHVLLIERLEHPRFHIGESLLPMSQPIFERLGIAGEVARIGNKKPGATFVSPRDGEACRYYFDRMLHRPQHATAYQVRRDQFDELMFRTAERFGAVAIEGYEVRTVATRPDGVHVSIRASADDSIDYRARQVVDATGRSAFMARHLVGLDRHPDHASAAVYGHFRGVELEPGDDQGNIRLYWFRDGWLWLIPFRDGNVSIGAVCWPDALRARRGDLNAFLWGILRSTPELADRVTDAQAVRPIEATGNYSYTARELLGDRWLLVGDAYAFVDPVYSSGVHIALNSAWLAADVLDARLSGNRADARRLARRYRRRLRSGIRAFSWFIQRMTQPAMRELFLAPGNTLRLQEAVTSLLGGDVFPIRPSLQTRLLAFRCIYYLTYLSDWRANRAATRRRKRAR